MSTKGCDSWEEIIPGLTSSSLTEREFSGLSKGLKRSHGYKLQADSGAKCGPVGLADSSAIGMELQSSSHEELNSASITVSLRRIMNSERNVPWTTPSHQPIKVREEDLAQKTWR